MLFCKIFRFVNLHFQKYENQNSSINNFIGPFVYQDTFTEDRNILVIKKVMSGLSYMGLSTIDKVFRTLSEGDLFGKIIIISEGSQYNQKRYCKNLPKKKKHIINCWINIRNYQCMIKRMFD
jgi:hypothetical protein